MIVSLDIDLSTMEIVDSNGCVWVDMITDYDAWHSALAKAREMFAAAEPCAAFLSSHPFALVEVRTPEVVH